MSFIDTSKCNFSQSLHRSADIVHWQESSRCIDIHESSVWHNFCGPCVWLSHMEKLENGRKTKKSISGIKKSRNFSCLISKRLQEKKKGDNNTHVIGECFFTTRILMHTLRSWYSEEEGNYSIPCQQNYLNLFIFSIKSCTTCFCSCHETFQNSLHNAPNSVID